MIKFIIPVSLLVLLCADSTATVTGRRYSIDNFSRESVEKLANSKQIIDYTAEKNEQEYKQEKKAKHESDCQKLETHLTDCIKKNKYQGLFRLSIFEPRGKKEFEPYVKEIDLTKPGSIPPDDEINAMENTIKNSIGNIISSTNLTGIIKIDLYNNNGKWYTLWSCNRSISFVSS
jgi:hypothetical protein